MNLLNKKYGWKYTFVLVALLAACTKKSTTQGNGEDTLVVEGRQTYNMHCTACHNANPKIDGSVGPSLYGSSLELIETRIMKAQYPTGYQPKRTTHIMVPFPFLKDKIPALHAYLNTP